MKLVDLSKGSGEPDTTGNYWSSLKKTEFDQTFPDTSVQMFGYMHRYTGNKTTTVFLKPRTLAIASFFIGILIFCSAFRVNTSYRTGDFISFKLAKSDQKTLDLLSRINGENVFKNIRFFAIEKSDELVFSAFLLQNGKSKDVVKTLQQAAGIDKIYTEPVRVHKKQSLLSVFFRKTFDIELKGPSVSNSEIQSSISHFLEEKHINSVSFEIHRDERNRPVIIPVYTNNELQPFAFSIKIKDGREEQNFVHKEKLLSSPVKLSDMSDPELKEWIIRQEPELMIEPEEVTISRTADKIVFTISKDNNQQFSFQFKTNLSKK